LKETIFSFSSLGLESGKKRDWAEFKIMLVEERRSVSVFRGWNRSGRVGSDLGFAYPYLARNGIRFKFSTGLTGGCLSGSIYDRVGYFEE